MEKKQSQFYKIFLSAFTALIFSATIFLLTNPAPAQAAILQRAGNKLGLVGYWTFDDNTGTKATDFSARGNTGTLTNMASNVWESGKIGRAITFDGSDDHVRVTDSASLRLTGNMTFSAWVYYTARGSFNYILEKGLNDDDNYAFFTDSTGHLNIEFQDNGNAYRNFADSTGIVPLNAWTHVAVVYDDTNNLVKFYINGAQTANPATAFTLKGTQTSDLFIGRQNAASAFSFSGAIDDVRLYGRGLSAPEIASLYATGLVTVNSSSGVQALSDGLLLWHTFDGAKLNSTTSTDSSFAANNGGLSGGPVSVIGKMGQALRFDGIDDVVTVTRNAGLEPTTGITLSAWVNPASITTLDSIIDRWSGSNGYYLGHSIGDTNLRFFLSTTGGNIDFNAGEALALGVWQHVVGTYDGTTARIYINGVQKNTSSVSGTISYATSTNDIKIGNGAGGGGEAFKARIDDVRIYGRALSAGEVVGLYGIGKATINKSIDSILSTGLIAWHTFDGPRLNTTTSTDSSTAGNNGTLTNGPVPSIGILGQSLKFAVSDDYVGLPGTILNSLEPDGSLSAWINFDATWNSTRGTEAYLYESERAGVYNQLYIRFPASDGHLFFGKNAADGLNTPEEFSSIQSSWTAKQWYHIVAVWQGTAMRVYVNGVLDNSSTKTSGINSNADTARIGNHRVGTLAFPGRIDDFRIYSRALSAPEVSALYNSR